MQKILAVGESDFKSFIESDLYYADKTAFLKDILTCGAKVLLITRPRGFGKTLALSTLKYFLEDHPDKNQHQKLFSGTAVFKDREFFSAHMGQFPVISLRFFSLTADSFEQLQSDLAFHIADAAKQHYYLYESGRLSDADRKDFAALLQYKDLEKDEARFLTSLATLSRLLYQHHGQKAVLLLDDYDAPFITAARHGFYAELLRLMRPLLAHAFRDNMYLEKAIVTGYLPIGGDGISEAMNSPSPNSVLTAPNPLAEAFGFTLGEIRELTDDYGFGAVRDRLRRFYGGFHFDGQEICSPVDALNYTGDHLNSKDNTSFYPQNFWLDTSFNKVIRDFLGLIDGAAADRLQALMDGRETELELKETLDREELEHRAARDFWPLFVFRGYLTAAVKLNPPGSAPRYMVRIPNGQIRNCFERNMLEFYTQSRRCRDLNAAIILHALKGEARELNDALNLYLSTYVSEKAFATEKYYLGLLDGILSKHEDLISDRESDFDTESYRHEIRFNSLVHNIRVIIRIKVCPGGSEPESAVADGSAEPPETAGDKNCRPGTTVIHAYSIAFWQRICLVRYQKR